MGNSVYWKLWFLSTCWQLINVLSTLLYCTFYQKCLQRETQIQNKTERGRTEATNKSTDCPWPHFCFPYTHETLQGSFPTVWVPMEFPIQWTCWVSPSKVNPTTPLLFPSCWEWPFPSGITLYALGNEFWPALRIKSHSQPSRNPTTEWQVPCTAGFPRYCGTVPDVSIDI